MGAANFPAQAHYGDASWVGYRLAELLPLPLTIKQHMLEINDAGVRLSALAQYCEAPGTAAGALTPDRCRRGRPPAADHL